MKNAVVNNSVIAYAGLQCFGIIKTTLKEIDELLFVVNRHSIIYNMLKSAAHNAREGVGRIYADAKLIRDARSIASRYLRIILEAMKVFLYSVYCDSFIMNFFGRVASGSVWAR